jgi:hypothetical protein
MFLMMPFFVLFVIYSCKKERRRKLVVNVGQLAHNPHISTKQQAPENNSSERDKSKIKRHNRDRLSQNYKTEYGSTTSLA